MPPDNAFFNWYIKWSPMLGLPLVLISGVIVIVCGIKALYRTNKVLLMIIGTILTIVASGPLVIVLFVFLILSLILSIVGAAADKVGVVVKEIRDSGKTIVLENGRTLKKTLTGEFYDDYGNRWLKDGEKYRRGY